MADINDVLQIARVFKSQAEADLMKDIYSKVLPTNMISFCDAVIELLKEQKEHITVLEEEAKTKCTPQKVLNRKELADLIVGECPLCGALFNNEICPVSCGWCGCLLDWKDGEQE